jgi:hypothetical protein
MSLPQFFSSDMSAATSAFRLEMTTLRKVEK